MQGAVRVTENAKAYVCNKVLMTQKRASLIAASSSAKVVMLSVTLVLCSMFNSGTQNAAEVLLAVILDASVYM